LTDQEIFEHVARELVERHGTDAIDVLREYADWAATEGDDLSVQAWLDIAADERIALTAPRPQVRARRRRNNTRRPAQTFGEGPSAGS
jgi:hypothetical protein